MPQYTLMSLNDPDYAWKCLKCFDYARGLNILIILDIWKDFECASYIKWARVMNMPRYSYHNIIAIFVTNVIILEFPPAWFVNPGAPQLTILSLFNKSWNIRINRLAKAHKLLINFSFLLQWCLSFRSI